MGYCTSIHVIRNCCWWSLSVCFSGVYIPLEAQVVLMMIFIFTLVFYGMNGPFSFPNDPMLISTLLLLCCCFHDSFTLIGIVHRRTSLFILKFSSSFNISMQISCAILVIICTITMYEMSDFGEAFSLLHIVYQSILCIITIQYF